MPQEILSYGIHDTCVSAFVPLNCDGTVNDALAPLPYCGLTESILRETIEEIDEQVVEGSRSDQNCLKRAGYTKPSDCFLDINTCGIQNPLLWSWMGINQPVYDDQGEICGFEPAEDTSVLCPSCVKTSASGCKHSVALVTIHNAWCGEDRHPDFDYVVNIYPSLKFEIQENEITYGSGFTATRSLSAKLQKNPNFIDPWGIVDAANTLSQKYQQRKLECPPGSPVEELVESGCGCGGCSTLEG